MTELPVRVWGEGVSAVLVHGSIATGAASWERQRPLADHAFRLLVPDRRGYGHAAEEVGEDFVRDAEDIAELLDDGANVVGHSYGGVAALLTAAARPGAVLSSPDRNPPLRQRTAIRRWPGSSPITGAGHEVQMVGEPFSEALLELWRSA